MSLRPRRQPVARVAGRIAPLAVAVAVAAVALVGCSNTGTALFLEVDVAQTPGVQQLHVTGRIEDRLIFGPAVRPERPGDPLDGTQTLRVLLPDDAAEATIVVQVDGLHEGNVRGRALAEAQPARGREVRLQLALEPASSSCADCDGCCQQGVCVGESVTACGSGGVQCFACDAVLADRCSGEGRCQCGEGPACSPAQGADRCASGECRCGNGPACPAGTQCDNGVCRCTPDSCAGCCDDNECVAGTTDLACGTGGNSCVRCHDGLQCSQGTCVP